jgi:hypothetical protein
MKKLPASQGFQWLNETLAFVRSDARDFFRLSALFLMVMLALTLPFEFPMLVAAKSHAPVAATPLMLMQLVISLFSPVLLAGWFHAFREHSAGRPVAPGQLFQGFRIPGMALRLASLGLISLAVAVLNVALVKWLLDADYYAIASGNEQAAEALGAGGMLAFYAISLGTASLSWAFLLFSIPRVFLDAQPPLAAALESLVAVRRNFLPLLLFVLGMIAFVLVIGLTLAVVTAVSMLLVTVLGKLAGLLGALLGLLFFIVMLTAIIYLLPVAYYPNYLMWRSMFGDDTAVTAAPGSFEA